MFVTSSKTYSRDIQLLVHDAIVNQLIYISFLLVPTANIPILLPKFAIRCGQFVYNVPHLNTIEMMGQDLDVQTAEAILENENVTLGFHSTIQKGIHINSIHITTVSKCYVIAVDELEGGTPIDYQEHICSSIGNLTAFVLAG
ncbi:hypothetical protein LSH36_165g04008 [Paralvinella palmiformis]|uniref:Uncharacterized protein n=1 Tax=Paralvinella palmiformis TaxID=53620 RepID=A0AAD9JSQ0_9ANNE|nr:hypothetical protein LSH36_165g04008 [Paralvinella palmiformis]